MIRTAAAAVDIQAAAAGDGVRRIRIDPAYNGDVLGGSMGRRGDWVADTAGMELAASIPLLAEHVNGLDAMLGTGTATVANGRVSVNGALSAPTDAAKKVLALLDSGTGLQASIGLEVLASELRRPGDKVTVNGRTITAGANGLEVITKSRLREVSIVALGYDPNTSVLKAALSAKGASMTLEDFAAGLGATLTDATRPAIQAAFTAAHPPAEGPATADELTGVLGQKSPLTVRAMSEGWTTTRARTEGLAFERAKLAAAATIAPFNPHQQFITGKGTPATTSDHLAAAMMVRAGFTAAAEKAYGPAVMEQSKTLHRASFLDLIAASLRADGRDVPHNRTELIRAGLSTGSMPVALGNAANKTLESQYAAAPATWRSWAAVRPAADFKEQTSFKPNFLGDLEEVGPAGQIKNGNYTESTFTWSVSQFAKMLTIDRKSVVNDDLGAFSEVLPAFGKAAARGVTDKVYTTLLANAGTHYGTANANYIEGATTNLGADGVGLGLGVRKIRAMVDADSNFLDLQPAVLLVPPEVEVNARQLLNSSTVSRIATGDNLPMGNPWEGLCKLEVEPRLSSSDYTGYSTTGWYLLTDPSNVGFVVGFLDGQQTPTVETFGFDADPSTLAMSMRVVFDYGCALGDPKAGIRSKGAA